MTSVEDITATNRVGSPIERLINALSTDPGLWHQVSVSFNSLRGMQVSMHGCPWAAVAEMTMLLGLDLEPNAYHRLQAGSPTLVVGFGYGEQAIGGVSVVWFVHQDYVTSTFDANRFGPLPGE